MSVISQVPTAEGLVIGSDGRSTDSSSGLITDDVQKIFSVNRPGMRLAFGVFGTATVGEDSNQVLFNFTSEAARAMISAGRSQLWARYIERVGEHLASSLNDVVSRTRKKLQASDRGTFIIIGGYFEKYLELAHILIDRASGTAKSEPHAYQRGMYFPFGSIALFDLLNMKDRRLSEYISPDRFSLVSLADGIKRVRNDIMAHFDPLALEIDPTCRSMGGRIQIATITRADGFRWLPGFEPKAFLDEIAAGR